MKKMLLVGLLCFAAPLVIWAQQRQALFLTAGTPTSGDVAVQNRLVQLGFTVTRVTDTASQSSDANGKQLIVVSSSVGSGNISTKFTASPVPLIDGEQAIYDDLGIDANNVGGATVPGQTQINIVDCTHPLAAGLQNGLVTVLTAAGPIVELGGAGTPVASAQIVAQATDGRASVFGIEAGAPLNPVRIANAPARRVGIFWEATTFMTPDGLKLFDAAVAWATGAPVPSDTPIAITSSPSNTTVDEGAPASFTVGFSGAGPYSIQWLRSDGAGGFTNIPEATCPTYRVAQTVPADNGAMFYAVVNNSFSSATSAVATLTVIMDNDGPVLVSASSVHSLDVGLCFNEALDPPSAANAVNYTVNGGAVPVASATLRYDAKTVQLVLGSAITGDFTVEVNNVLDRTGRNAIAPRSKASGSVAGLDPTDIGAAGDPVTAGSTFSCRQDEFEIIAGGSDIWGNGDHGHFAYVNVIGDFDKRVLVARVENTDPSAKAGLMVREGISLDSRDLHAIVMPEPPARNIYETGTRSATGGGTAGWGVAGGGNGNLPANHPNSWMRLRRSGDKFRAYVSSNGVDWMKNGESIQSYSDGVVVGLAATAHNNDGRVNHALFRNFSDTASAYPGASVTITRNPSDVSIEENHPAGFSAAATVSGAPVSELEFQWQRDDGAGGFTNIPAATASTFGPIVTLDDNGAQFRVVASIPGASAVSSVATLSVRRDITAPVIVSARRGCLNLSEILVVFNEQVQSGSAGDSFNYSVDNYAITISAVTVGPDGMSVLITTAEPLANGVFHIVTVTGVADVANNVMPESKTVVDLGESRVPVDGAVVIEAENYDGKLAQGGKDWVFSSSPAGIGTFSGPGYMQALPESGAAINEPAHLTQSPRLDYCINFPVGGICYVWLRGNDIVGGANSLHAGIDNTDSPDPNDNRIGNSGGATGWGDAVWKWTRDADLNTRVAFVTVPSAGLHSFSVWMREDSVIVDKILLTTDANFTFSPNTVLGPAESGRGSNMPPPPIVKIERSGSAATISWSTGSVGTLQEADQITGPWQPTSDAANPYPVTTSASNKFYRVVIP